MRDWIERLSRLPLADREGLSGMEKGRADVIVAGLVIIERVWNHFGVAEFRISGRGVRHGVAAALRGPL